MKHSIFIKSYNRDFPWLRYCLKSLAKFVSGFDAIHIVVPEQDFKELAGWNLTREQIHSVKERGDPYLYQQAVKLSADNYCGEGMICFVDSDCCFDRPTTPEDFYLDDKPLMLMTKYRDLPPPPEMPWKSITEKTVGFKCEYEFMRRLPFFYPSWILPEFRAFIRKTHGQAVDDYIVSQPNRSFSEFNALGSYAWKYHPDAFAWWDTVEKPELPPARVHQNWSWGGLKPEIIAKLEEITA